MSYSVSPYIIQLLIQFDHETLFITVHINFFAKLFVVSVVSNVTVFIRDPQSKLNFRRLQLKIPASRKPPHVAVLNAPQASKHFNGICHRTENRRQFSLC